MQDIAARVPPIAVRALQGLALLGGVSLGAGLVLAPQQTWAELLLASNFLLGLALGGLVLLALHYVTGARWIAPLCPLLEAMTVVLPAAGVGVLAVLICYPELYATAPTTHIPASPFRTLWLNRAFFLIRSVVYVGVWLAFAWGLLRLSRQVRQQADADLVRKTTLLSALFLVAFGVTCWLASYDWIMALEPAWSSTVFGVYFFAGLFVSALAACTLLAIWLRRQGAGRSVVTDDRLHDLGTLLFGFSSFWMYTWFCQYLLIWYTNHEEETAYFRLRSEGVWPVLVIIDLVLSWGVPFVVLLFREAKRRPLVLGAVCVVVLLGRWLDLYLMIVPSQTRAPAVPGAIEAGMVLGTVGIFGLVVWYALAKSAVPDPSPAAAAARR
jgi:hypothetical protein